MCIAAISKKDGFTEIELRAFFRSNRNGGGFAWVDENNILQTERYIIKEADYVEKGLSLAKYKNLVTHCRITTMGSTDEHNAHPFPIIKNNKVEAAVVHNGHFYTTYKKDAATNSSYSDTRSLVEGASEIFLDTQLMSKKETLVEIGDIVGLHNKMIILYPSNNFVIINENSGIWENNKWYSNQAWLWHSRNL